MRVHLHSYFTAHLTPRLPGHQYGKKTGFSKRECYEHVWKDDCFGNERYAYLHWFSTWVVLLCFTTVCDWPMKETWASLSNKKMQNEKQVWLNDEHFSYLWLFTLSYQSSLVTSFSYTVKPVLGGHLRRMAGGGGGAHVRQVPQKRGHIN